MQTPTDPFAFLKSAWPGFPPAANLDVVSADIQDIDRRISDLKTVEQWLNLNLNILKTTIQGLEIQRGTIAAVQSWQAAVTDLGSGGLQSKSNARSGSQPDIEPSHSPNPEPEAPIQAQWWWSSMQDQFNQLIQAARAIDNSESDAATNKATPSNQTRPKSRGKGGSRSSAASKNPKST